MITILRYTLGYFKKVFILNVKNRFVNIYGYKAKTSEIDIPFSVNRPKNVYLYEYTRIQENARIINSTGKFIFKKYSVASNNLTVVTGNHVKTVGIPQILLVKTKINDNEIGVIVEEDVWIGINVSLLAGTHIGRGSVIGACSLVNKKLPPYCVAVGNPAKIIGSTYTLEETIKHEKIIYPPNERLSEDYLKEVFLEFYKDKNSIGVDNLNDITKNLLSISASNNKIKLNLYSV